MTDKNITIKGLVSFDTSAAQKSLNEITKSFTKIDKTSFNKMNDEFKKMSGTIKGLDKDAFKFMDRLAKKDAKDQIKAINNVLKEQAQFLKDAVKQQDALTDAIERTSDAKKKDALIKQREENITNARQTMGNISDAQKRRDELLGQNGRSQQNGAMAVIQKAATIGAVTVAVKEVISHFTGLDYRKMGYEGQAQSAPNKMANMMFSKSLDYGILAATGGLGRALKAGEDVQTGTIAKHGIQALGNVGGGAVAGSFFGPGGSLVGGFTGLLKSLGDVADLINPKTRDVALKAERSNITSESIENLRAKHAFAIDLANERLGLAPAKQAAAQALAGYGSAGSLEGKVARTMSQGWQYGYSIPESAAMAQMSSSSGLIGRERGDISKMALFERAGLSSPGETADLTRRTGGVANDQQKIMKMFEQAMQKGVQTGIEKSLVKDLVLSATSLAEGGTARIDSLDGIMSDLRSSLGTMRNNEIGRADIMEAQNAVGKFRSLKGGGGTAMGLAIQTMGMQEALQASGLDIGKMSTTAIMALSRATSSGDVKANAALMDNLYKIAGPDGASKVQDFVNNKFDEAKEIGVIRQRGWAEDTSDIDTPEKRAAYRAGTRKGASADQSKKSMDIFNRTSLTYQAMYPEWSVQQADKMAAMDLGQQLRTDPKASIENTYKPTSFQGDLQFGADVEQNREKLRNKPDFKETIKDAMQAQKNDMSGFSGPNSKNIFEPGGSMVVSLGSLESAVKELTAVLMARGKIPDTRDPYTVPEPPSSTLQQIKSFFVPGMDYPTAGSVQGK